MSPIEYQERRVKVRACVDQAREAREALRAKDPLFFGRLTEDVRQRLDLLDRDSTRLANPDLTVAFIGGFSAGKSSLINAFLGRYLLPESTKVTTAVPTFVRSAGGGAESAELHYLSEAEVDKLGELYRTAIAQAFHRPELATATISVLLETVRPLAKESGGGRLVEQFETYLKERRTRAADARGRVVTTTLVDAQAKIRDETEAMFLDRVVLRIDNAALPTDVVLVDLPGISVPNPRHREVTFRFVREEAHALVFVLMATRLIDKDETEILDLVRAGESRIADKVFYVLNRWDSLTSEQRRQTDADFERKMADLALAGKVRSFRTNALHGLLSQLAERGERPDDAALRQHFVDYEDALPRRYDASHRNALQESQLPQLQREVFGFLNERLRRTVIESACENTRKNFCDPITHHVRVAKEADENLLGGELKREEREVSREKLKARCGERTDAVKIQISDVLDEIVNQRGAILEKQADLLINEMRDTIHSGPDTNAYEIYKKIMKNGETRKVPYHFEIEIALVSGLNETLKSKFRTIVRKQVEEVFAELIKRVRAALDAIGEDVRGDAQVVSPLNAILDKGCNDVDQKIDGLLIGKAAALDMLLLFKPPTFANLPGLRGRHGNKILEGLEAAARVGFENLRSFNEPVKAEHLENKTRAIRQTLSQHYIDRVRTDYLTVVSEIPILLINAMQGLQRDLLESLDRHYEPAMELVIAQEVEGEFAGRRRDVEVRTRRFRDLLDHVDTLNASLGQLACGPADEAT